MLELLTAVFCIESDVDGVLESSRNAHRTRRNVPV